MSSLLLIRAESFGEISMYKRFLILFFATAFLSACETASTSKSDSAGSAASSTSGNASSSASSSTSTGGSASSSASSSAAGSSSTKSAVDVKKQFESVGTTIRYDYDSSEITSSAQMTLDRQAAFLKAKPSIKIIIGGHCDERGTREYNLALGERRAAAAKDYLVSKGVNSARIKIISYGKERPIATGSNEGSWARNRRAVSVIN